MILLLGFLPPPQPDELLYSILARYRARSASMSPKAMLRILFGSSTASAVLDLPCNIGAFCHVLPYGAPFDEDYFIWHHTLFPLYQPFVSEEQASLTYGEMLGKDGRSIAARLGVMASSIRTNVFIKFCPACFHEEIYRYGEAYWHRLHQIAGVLVCPTHQALLQDSGVKVHEFNKHEFHPASPLVCNPLSQQENMSNQTFCDLLDLASDVEWLLNNRLPQRDLAWYREAYIRLLISAGLATQNGRVDQRSMHEEILKRYSYEFLQLVQSPVSYDDKTNWLMSLVRKPRHATHPIRHLLFMRFLGQSISSFHSMNSVHKPFGNGPWPCLNAAAQHYRRNIVDNVVITYSHKRKTCVGTFSCACGFRYSRSGPDTRRNDRFRVGRIKEFGIVWKNKLSEMLTKNALSMREIARRLHVDVNTVIHHATLCKSICIQNENDKCVMGVSDLKEVHRATWVTTLQENPGLSKTQLRKKLPAVYVWLYRHDNNWLNMNSPTRKMQSCQPSRVNWDERDAKLLLEIQQKVRELLLSEEKPERITISRMGTKIGKLAMLEKNIDKLPSCKEYLSEIVESVEQFQVRRILWATSKLQASGQLTEWRIYKLAGIRPNCSKRISDVVLAVLSDGRN